MEEEQYYPKTKTECVLKAADLVRQTLEENHFYVEDFGCWFLRDNNDSVGIQFEYHPDNLHIILKAVSYQSTVNEPAVKQIILEAENLELVASVLDNLIFAITKYER